MMKMTVAQVSKVLASGSKICECGNTVVCDEDGSYIKDKKTGKKTQIHKRNGVYVMDIRMRNGPIVEQGSMGAVDQDANEVFRGWEQIWYDRARKS